MNRIDKVRELYTKAADEAIAKGHKLSRDGAGYIGNPKKPICINAAVAMVSYKDGRSYQNVAAEKLGITFREASCVEGGFCDWPSEYCQTHPELYNLGVELRNKYNA